MTHCEQPDSESDPVQGSEESGAQDQGLELFCGDSCQELCEEGLEARLEVTGQFGLIAGIIFRAIDFSLKRQI